MKWIIIIFGLNALIFNAAQGQIIDVHMHGYTADDYYGGKPNPANGIASPATIEEHRKEILAYMDEFHIQHAVMSASIKALADYTALDKRFIPAYEEPDGALMDPAKFEKLVKAGKIKIFGEIMAVYKGRSLSDPVYEPYLAIAEKYDIPVAVHTGTSHPGLANSCCPNYRIESGNPLTVEDALIRHPKLRVYLMHAGAEHYQQALDLMYQFPRLYVDVAGLLWIDDFTKYYAVKFLKAAKATGMIDRVMFGSDEMVWPGAIPKSIKFLNSLDFLSKEDKHKIFYSNAKTFLKLQD